MEKINRLFEVIGNCAIRYFRWQRKPKNLLGAAFLFYGLPGFVEDTETWARWLTARWEWIRGTAAELEITLPPLDGGPIVEFLASDWTRWGALAIAVLLFNWRAAKLAGARVGSGAAHITKRFARKTQIVVQETLHQEVWLTHQEAIAAVRESDWGRYMKKRGEEPRYRWSIALASMDTTNPKEEAKSILFSAWVKRVLRKYADQYGEATKLIDGQTKYNKAHLDAYLDDKFESLIVDNFGPVE